MLAAGCALKSRFWCTTHQKVRRRLAFLIPQKRPKSALFFYTALQDGSERNKDREANPAGSQMACRPGVFYEPQQPTGRWKGGLEVSLERSSNPTGVIPELLRGASKILRIFLPRPKPK